MFEKKVVVTDDYLTVGQTKIFWDNIAGIREQDDPLLRKISNRFPRVEIFLKGGKVVAFSNMDKIQNKCTFNQDDVEDVFQITMEVIKKNVPETVGQSKAWFEWRLLLPIIMIEIFIFLGCVLTNQSFEKTISLGIAGGIFGATFGWYWERRARKMRYS